MFAFNKNEDLINNIAIFLYKLFVRINYATHPSHNHEFSRKNNDKVPHRKKQSNVVREENQWGIHYNLHYESKIYFHSI